MALTGENPSCVGTVSMSALGQKAKYSLRVHKVCFAPESGLKTDIAGGPFGANNGSDISLNHSSARARGDGSNVRPSRFGRPRVMIRKIRHHRFLSAVWCRAAVISLQ